jgi:hypothetical protein
VLGQDRSLLGGSFASPRMHRQHLPAVCCEGPLIAADVVPSVGARLESNSYGWGHQFRDDDALYVVHDEDDWETTPL